MDLMQDTLTVQMSSKTEWCIWSTCTTRPSGCILRNILVGNILISWVSTGRHRTTRNHMNHLAHQRPNGLPTRTPTDKGAPIYDICKIVRFFYPLPPFPNMEPIYTSNSRDLPYYTRFSMTPLPLECRCQIWTLHKVSLWSPWPQDGNTTTESYTVTRKG